MVNERSNTLMFNFKESLNTCTIMVIFHESLKTNIVRISYL